MAGDDHGIVDRNNGHRHEIAFTSLVRDNGLLWEAELLPRSYGGDSFFAKFAPAAGAEMVASLPAITKALIRGKVTIGGALKPHRLDKKDIAQVKSIYEAVEGRDERYELNLYISGADDDTEDGAEGMPSAETGQPGTEPEESPTR
jgi:succinate dehydrogenase / fumarate reductase, iron-sulfur subunit